MIPARLPHVSCRKAARRPSRLFRPFKGLPLVALALTAGLVEASAGGASAAMAKPATPGTDAALRFDPRAYTPITVQVDGQKVAVRWYKDVCYVTRPEAMAAAQSEFGMPAKPIANPRCGYQSMNIYVPETAAADRSTALYFAVNNGGWFASYVKASIKDGDSFASATSNVGAAIKAGYVYIDVGTRGRGIITANGGNGGKAPAAVVDAKAAIRYLRRNDGVMPGSAERIVVNGTSGGGGLTAVLGASGNSAAYLPYLRAIGAAGTDAHHPLRDDVFAVQLYCPITDLGHADMAYEWLYTALGTRAATGADGNAAASRELAAAFETYQHGLGLHDDQGRPLEGQALLEEVRHQVIRSAQAYMAAGNTIPALGEELTYTSGGLHGDPVQTAHYRNDWLKVDNQTHKVLSLDLARYLVFVGTQARLKDVPAFDQRGLSTIKHADLAESTLFGTAAMPYANFTPYAWNHNDSLGDGIGKDDTGLDWAAFRKTPSGQLIAGQTALIDPFPLIGHNRAITRHWYIRHGERDRDTAFVVSINLAHALAADPRVADVDYRLAWNQPHSGNYDVPEAMAWIAATLAKAGQPTKK